MHRQYDVIDGTTRNRRRDVAIELRKAAIMRQAMVDSKLRAQAEENKRLKLRHVAHAKSRFRLTRNMIGQARLIRQGWDDIQQRG